MSPLSLQGNTADIPIIQDLILRKTNTLIRANPPQVFNLYILPLL